MDNNNIVTPTNFFPIIIREYYQSKNPDKNFGLILVNDASVLPLGIGFKIISTNSSQREYDLIVKAYHTGYSLAMASINEEM